jgi:hypothetical protein
LTPATEIIFFRIEDAGGRKGEAIRLDDEDYLLHTETGAVDREFDQSDTTESVRLEPSISLRTQPRYLIPQFATFTCVAGAIF